MADIVPPKLKVKCQKVERGQRARVSFYLMFWLFLCVTWTRECGDICT